MPSQRSSHKQGSGNLRKKQHTAQETFSNRLNVNAEVTNAGLQRASIQTGVFFSHVPSSLLISLVSVGTAVGKGLIICTGTAVLKPKNNPQSVVHRKQSTPIGAEQPSGGKPAKTVEEIHT